MSVTPLFSVEEDELNFTPFEFTEFAIRLKGEPIDLTMRPWLERIYNMPVMWMPPGGSAGNIYDVEAETRRKMLLVFGRQSEKSTTIGNLLLALANLIPYLRLLYVTASNIQMREFSDERLRAVISDSPILSGLSGAGNVGKREVQNVQTKRWVNQAKIILRSVYKDADRVRGIPADMLGIDELQDIYTDSLPVIEETLFRSEIEGGPISLYSGTPKTFDNPLEFYWSRYSTQNEWVIKCGCGQWVVVEDKHIGPRGLLCDMCSREMNPVDNAQWARMGRAKQEWEGFHLCQPIVAYSYRNKPELFTRIWQSLLDKRKRYPKARFMNEVMGRSYDAGTKPVTLSEMRKCCLPELKMETEPTKGMQQAHSWAGVDWGCHDDQTRILTENGWKYFKDLGGNDKVAQIDPETRDVTYVTPSRTVQKHFDGDLIHFQGRGIDMMLTPDHKMRVRGQQASKWSIEPAGHTATRAGHVNLMGWGKWKSTADLASFTFPGLPTSPGYRGCEPVTYTMSDWMELLGYWLSEGGLCIRKNRPYCIKMSQRASVNPIQARKIKACMDRMGLPYAEYPNPITGDLNWTTCGKQYWHWWAEHIGLTGNTKRIPREFLSLPTNKLQILFDAMVLGDGSVDKREGNQNGCYSSTSIGLIEDFQELCMRLGLKTSVRMQAPAEGNRKARYVCSFSHSRDPLLSEPKKRVTYVPYSGNVYCCTVPTGFIITERNGRVAFQGNSGDESYSILSIWYYDPQGRFALRYAKRYEGIEADPDFVVADIIRLCRKHKVNLIGVDWGFGFGMNSQLKKAFGAAKVVTYFHSSKQKAKVAYDKVGFKFVTHRSRVLQDVFTLIKRGPVSGGICLPGWEEVNDKDQDVESFANDILSVYTEYSESRRELVFDHPRGVPDDFLHTVVYALLVSQLMHQRPDLHAPGPRVKFTR